jgi:hypothetical protein
LAAEESLMKDAEAHTLEHQEAMLVIAEAIEDHVDALLGFGVGAIGQVFGKGAQTGAGSVDDIANAYSRIGSTGKVGEDALKLLGARSQAYFPTSMGGRRVDQLVLGVAHEAKVGYVSLGKDVAKQIAKDVELVQTNAVAEVIWHFFRSPVTGRIGGSAPLYEQLRKAGIGIVVH